MSKNRILCYTGVTAILAAWITIFLSWKLNPWFNVFEDAYSDLGGPAAYHREVYNYGLILTGLLVFLWGAYIAIVSRGRFGVIGGSYMALAGVFLALIGVYPSGTRPHTFVSTWFFIQADLALIAIGMELRGFLAGRLIVALSVLAFPLALLVEATLGWPSTAILETYGIVIIDAGVLLATSIICRETQNSRPSS
ncbi:MAG: DUF998 domain-containing protein [Desulfurococcales archaeon]|nr:DUF998 domain-containing protein [Desulfurococcales archaeon]